MGKLCLATCFYAILLGCTPAKSAEPTFRSQARAAVLDIAWALHTADEVCSEKAMALGVPDGIILADKCAAAIQTGAASLHVAEDILDAWSDANVGKMSCAIGAAIKTLKDTEAVLTSVGVKSPAEVEDAISLTSWVGRFCMETK